MDTGHGGPGSAGGADGGGGGGQSSPTVAVLYSKGTRGQTLNYRLSSSVGDAPMIVPGDH